MTKPAVLAIPDIKDPTPKRFSEIIGKFSETIIINHISNLVIVVVIVSLVVPFEVLGVGLTNFLTCCT